MTDTDLDMSYTALCEALAQVGQAQAPLFLSMVCLALIGRAADAQSVLPLIANARQQCMEEGEGVKVDTEEGSDG